MNYTNYFTKLNLDFSDTKLDELKLQFGKSYLDANEKEIVVINWADEQFQNHIKSKLPESFRSWIRSVRITYITDSTPPHKDHGGCVCINYYLETSDGPTTFWLTNYNAQAANAIGQSTANLYRFEDLSKTCSFVAKPLTCYLLNTGEVHTVDIEKNSVRKIIQLIFEPAVTYIMVLDKCKELNLVEAV